MILGNSLEQITYEKAGIIKENIKKTLLLLCENVFDVSSILIAKNTLQKKRIDIIISEKKKHIFKQPNVS